MFTNTNEFFFLLISDTIQPKRRRTQGAAWGGDPLQKSEGQRGQK